jgi:hypothetical protein
MSLLSAIYMYHAFIIPDKDFSTEPGRDEEVVKSHNHILGK